MLLPYPRSKVTTTDTTQAIAPVFRSRSTHGDAAGSILKITGQKISDSSENFAQSEAHILELLRGQ
jgi:hypothetical protein